MRQAGCGQREAPPSQRGSLIRYSAEQMACVSPVFDKG